ncbi:MAG: Spy/CpxP family protein refolding chaperone [Gemmatimonadales bacterium]
MKRASALTVALGLLIAAGLPAQQHMPGAGHQHQDPLARFLFPPELVMQQQRAIALTPDQRTAVTRAIQEFHGTMVDLQWQVQDESQRLAELIEKPRVDRTAALAQVDKVLAVEREVKRAHLGLLIQIKNTLTAEQQAKLAALRAEGDGRP